MKLDKWAKLGYAYLAVYYGAALAITPANVFAVSIILISISLFFIFLYIYIHDELLFYSYVLFSIFVVIVPFSAMPSVNIMSLAVLYTLMAPLLLHIITMHFSPYGKIMKNTYIIYLSSLPLSLLLAYMIMYLHGVGSAYIIVTLIVAVILVYYLLLRDSIPKSE